MADSNDDLVHALESIKGLLEQSELKLSAARQSIRQASGSAAEHAGATPAPDRAEDLEEAPIEDIEAPIEDIDAAVPVLEDVVIPADSETGEPPKIDTAVLKDYLDEMQQSIEKNMRNTLMQAVVRAEGDLKKQLRAYMDQIRNILDEIE